MSADLRVPALVPTAVVLGSALEALAWRLRLRFMWRLEGRMLPMTAGVGGKGGRRRVAVSEGGEWGRIGGVESMGMREIRGGGQ